MKSKHLLPPSLAAVLVTSLFAALAPTANATPLPDLVYNVTLNVNTLSQLPNGPFSLDLQLVQGSGNVTNTVKLTNFVFTGGSTTGTSTYASGNESGSLASGVTLTLPATPQGLVSEYAEALPAGVTQISFNVDQTPNSELVGSGTPIPDQFNVSILDSNLNNVVTTDPSGSLGDTYTLVSSAISDTETASQVKYYTLVAPVPEPSTYATLISGLVALGAVAFRRRTIKG